MNTSRAADLRASLMILLSITALSVGLSSPIHAQILGAATDYNAFFFSDASASNVDIGGTIAVGGNATFNNYTIAQDLPANSGLVAVIGGNYLNNNANINGAIVVGGNMKHVNPTIKGDVTAKGSVDFTGGGGSVTGTIRYGTTFSGPGYDINGANPTTQVSPGSITLPVDFAAAKTDLSAKSASFGSLTPSLSNLGSNNNIQVTLTSGLNVLNLTAAQLAGASSFTIAGGAQDALLINVLDSGTVNVANFGTNFSGGVGVGNVLYNFVNASTVNLAGSFNGSALATKALVKANFGAFNGQLVANAGQTNGLQINNIINGQTTTLKAKSFNTAAIPEPTSLALLIVTVAIVGVRRRR
jgi:choice-of-anchor A domain-containing protein